MSKPPSASTSLYFDHSHLTNSTSNPSSLKKPFSTAQKIGASHVIPMYPTRIFVRFPPWDSEVFSVLLHPTIRTTALSAMIVLSLNKDMAQYWGCLRGKKGTKKDTLATPSLRERRDGITCPTLRASATA